MPLKIALTHEYSWPDVRRGGERYLHELAGALARRGHRVTIIAGANRFGFGREDGVRVVRLARRLRGVRIPFRVVLAEMGALLAAERFDVVHSLGPRDALQSIRARRIHGKRTAVYTDLGNPIRSWWESQPNGAAHARVVADVDVYGCLSRFALGCLRRDYGRDGALTPGGVRTDVFTPVAPRSRTPTLLFSGAIDDPRKGVGGLLRAFELVLRSEPAAELWLSGPGDATDLLASAPAPVRDRTTVLPLGTPYDQPDRYSRAWATVLPSTDEAFGLALVESLACGTPIVGLDHAALPELVTEGVGAIAAPGNDPSLAAACLEALELARTTSTRDTCRDASLVHDWDGSVAPSIEGVYLGR